MSCTFGVFHLPTFDPALDGSPSEPYGRLRRLILLADELEFHSAWLAEHHFQAHGGILSAPDLWIASLAPMTSRIRFGLGVVQVPYHHPLAITERIATLDHITGGRLDVGLGRGFLKCEYDGFGISMDHSRARFGEGVGIIVEALRCGSIERAGEHFTFPSLTVQPPCVQRPSPPLWIAAAATPETYSWAGRNGFNLMVAPLLSPDPASLREKIDAYYEARAEAGLSPDAAQLMVNVHVHVAETAEAARAEADQHLLHYVAETKAAGSSAIATFMRDGLPKDFAHYPALGRRWGTFTVDDAVEKSSVIIGDPDTCAERLAGVIVGMRCTTVVGMFDFGQPQPQVESSMRLFAERVAPQLLVGSR